MTREAFDVYLQKLASGGMLVLHISNAFLDFEPVVAVTAKEMNLQGRVQHHVPMPKQLDDGCYPSSYVVLARRDADLKGLVSKTQWTRLKVNERVRVWTDQRSSV